MTELTGGGEEEESKPRTVLVGNIPRGTSKRDLEEIFGEVGPLKRLHVQYPRDDKMKGGRKDDETLLAYVTFALSTDAASVVETMGSTLKIGGKKVMVKLVKQSRREEETSQRSTNWVRPPRDSKDGGEGEDEGGNPNRIPVAGQEPQERKKKEIRPKGPNKKSRLIVRNLSFKATEEKLKEHFSTCGSLKEVNILKKPDGRMVGCAFVQFETVPQAAAAVRDLNLKPFLGRPIAIDWALPKTAFQGPADKTEVKEEEEEDVKPEIVDLESEDKKDIKKAEDSNPYAHLGDDVIVTKKEEVSSEDEDEDDEHDEEDSEDEDKPKPGQRPKKSDDVAEGKTLFIRNVPFSATQESLADLFKSYGELVYALLVVDPLTEHPKGTAFVKYKDAGSATSCLTAFNVTPDEFSLDGRRLSVTSALSRNQVTSKATEEQKESDPANKKDSRNLWLGREGFIRPGSSAADGVSASDLNRRAALAQTKKQLLRNLAVFVSRDRLCIHNLPVHFSDKALRKLFKKHAPPTARVTEARIMRDMKDPDLQGKGKSKGFGFVTFTEHEHALAALRTVNNNPEIFGPNQRPIVEFSLENRKAIVAKEKRMLKSQENNPRKRPAPSEDTSEPQIKKNFKGPNKNNKPRFADKNNKPRATAADVNVNEASSTRGPQNKKPRLAKGAESSSASGAGAGELPAFSGLKGLRGVSKLPAIKPKGSSSKITRKSLRGKTIKNKILERRKREKQVKPKFNVNAKKDSTERHVERHSATLKKISKGLSTPTRQKWYSAT